MRLDSNRQRLHLTDKISQVTVDLDVLVRDDLLKFLKADSEARGATILCKYHTFSPQRSDLIFQQMQPTSSMA